MASTGKVRLSALSGDNAGTLIQTAVLSAEAGADPVKISANGFKNGKFVLSEEDGLAPDNLTVQRVGDDLAVSMEGAVTEQPQLLIENFYQGENTLAGLAEDGSYHAYVGSDVLNSVAQLSPGMQAGQALSAAPLEGMSGATAFGGGLAAAGTTGVAAGGGFSGMGLLAGLGGLGGLAIAGTQLSNKNDGTQLSNKNDGDKTIPPRSAIAGVTDNAGWITGQLAKGAITDDAQPTLTGTGKAGNTITIYDNGRVIGTLTVPGDGNWGFRPPIPLSDGTHQLTTTDRGADGTSAPSAPFQITVDTSIPATPVATITDTVSPVTGPIQNGGFTNDNRPVLSGTGKPGDIILVLDNGGYIGEVTVGANGTWTFKPDPSEPLGEGAHSITLLDFNTAGVFSNESAPLNFTVDTVAPLKPVIASVTDNAGDQKGPLLSGSVTDDERPVLRGTAEAGSTVTIYDNGVAIGTATANLTTGAWRFTPALPLTDGLHSITVVAQDAAGNRSIASDPFSLNLDGRPAPAAPAITGVSDAVGAIQGAIAPNGSTDDTRPTISGTAAAGTRISVYDGNVLLGTTVAGGSGSWSFRPATALSDGVHFFTATATSVTGNISVPTTVYEIKIDTSVPAAPTGVTVTDDVGPVTGVLASGTTTDDANPTLSGTTLANATVNILDNGVKIGSVVANNSGVWSYTPTTPLADGSHALTTQTVSLTGITGPSSAAITITVDTSAVEIALQQVADAVGSIQGPLSRGGVTDDPRPTFSGIATALATVNIYDGATLLGVTTANASGAWSFRPGSNLSEGSHSFTVESVNGAGAVSPRTAAFDLTVDVTAPTVPVINTVTDDVGIRQGNLISGSFSDDTTPTLSGINRTPGETIRVYDNGVLLGQTKVDSEGAWHFTPASRADGVHSFTVTAADVAGNVSSASSPFVVNVDTAAPAKPVITSVIDDAGDVIGPLTSGRLTDDATPTLNGTAEANSTILIYNNTTVIGSTTTNGSGVWSFTPATPLINGSYNLTAVAQDAAGNASPASDNFNFALDAGGKPAAPAITGIIDDVGSIQGVITKNGVTDDPTPTMRGTAQAGSTVSVYDGVTLLGTTTADASGNWTLTRRLADGSHSITATATSNTGNVSPATGAYVFSIDTSIPAAASSQTVTDDVGIVTGPITSGMITDDANPTLSGSALANATIRIYDDNLLIGTTQADASGNWSFTPLTPLTDGTHTLTTTVVNAAGTASAPSAALTFTIDTAVAVAITEVKDGVGSIQGALARNGVTDDQRPVISGSATAGATINVYDGALLLGSTTANINGQWQFTPTANLAEGAHSITVEAINGGVTSPRTVAFGFTVDITPPAVPAITGALDDVGILQGSLSNGASTDDTTPTLTGSGGVVGDKIAIYDGSKLLGTTEVQAGGNWSFTPTSPLLNGSHSFTIKASDAAGNTSAASAVFVLVIDTSVPTTLATVRGMSKDDGLNNSDFVTNDGSAGRGVYGTLSAALGAGESLRVSTDGGTTWTNAVVNGTNWSMVDNTAHNASWTIRTQVVNAVGNTSTSSQLVTLDVTAPNTPASIVYNALKNGFDVGLAGTNAVAGDMVNLQVNGSGYTYILTAQDIVKGTATVPSSYGAGGAVAGLRVNIIDVAGNSSGYFFNGKAVENFDNFPTANNVPLAVGTQYASSDMTFQLTTGVAYIADFSDYSTPGRWLWFGAGNTSSSIKLSNFGAANSFQFTYSGHESGPISFSVFDTNGILITTQNVANLEYRGTISYTAPAGQTIGSFVINQSGDPNGIAVDNIVITGNAQTIPLSNTQIIDTASHAFYGSAGSDVFSLPDTTFLTGTNAGVHGGTGVDTLKLTGANMTLDLTGLTGYNDQGKISSIEKIDLTGTGNNTLKLSLNDVLHLGQTNLMVTDGKTQFAVTGNSGDAVVLSKMHDNGVDGGSWVAQGAPVTVGGVVYTVYEHSTLHAELFVQQGVSTTLV